MCQKSVWNVSHICQKSVRFRTLSEICQMRIRNPSEMCQPSELCQKFISCKCRKLSELCQKWPNWQLSDTFLNKSRNIFRKHFPAKTVRKLSDIWSDTFLTIFTWKCFLKMFLHLIRNVSDNCQLDHFWHNSDSFSLQCKGWYRYHSTHIGWLVWYLAYPSLA